MKPSEAVTIYLAIGASFGAAHIMNAQRRAGLRVWTESLLWAIVWPVAALQFLRRYQHDQSAGAFRKDAPRCAANSAERARREFEIAIEDLHRVTGDVVLALPARNSTLGILQDAIARHFELRTALANLISIKEPAPLALELCRVAGRHGDELTIAASCIHRRNCARLRAHCERSAHELIHHLAALHEITEAHALTTHDSSFAHRASAARFKLYGAAVEFLSYLDDTVAVMRVARLLDAECARLRQLENGGKVVMALYGDDGEKMRRVTSVSSAAG